MATASNPWFRDANASLTPARFPVNWLWPKAIENVLRLQLFDMNVLGQRKCLHSENIHTKIGKNVHSTKGGAYIKNKCKVNHKSASHSPHFVSVIFGCCSWERSLYWAARIGNASVFTGGQKKNNFLRITAEIRQVHAKMVQSVAHYIGTAGKSNSYMLEL